MKTQIVLRNFNMVDLHEIYMPMITVYKNPSDFPGKYVAKLWRLDKPTIIVVVKDTLPEIRMAIPRHMIRFPRHQKDDPTILETWL